MHHNKYCPERKQKIAAGIAEGCVSVQNTPAEKYLNRRGVNVPPGTLVGYKPDCPVLAPRTDRPLYSRAPALIWRCSNPATGEIIDSIAIVYIDADGQKLPVSEHGGGARAKLSYGPRAGSGAGVVFGSMPDARAVLIGEGCETVLAACNSTGLPGIAALGQCQGGLDLPDSTRLVMILADRTALETTRRQAEKLASRYPEVKVKIAEPPPPNAGEILDDFNDLLMLRGADEVRAVLRHAWQHGERIKPPKPRQTFAISPENQGLRSLDQYQFAAIKGEAANVAAAPEGARNLTLNRSAFALGRLGIAPEEIARHLGPIALQIGIDRPQAWATIQSGALSGARNLREVVLRKAGR